MRVTDTASMRINGPGSSIDLSVAGIIGTRVCVLLTVNLRALSSAFAQSKFVAIYMHHRRAAIRSPFLKQVSNCDILFLTHTWHNQTENVEKQRNEMVDKMTTILFHSPNLTPWSWTGCTQPPWRPRRATPRAEKRKGRSDPTRGLDGPPRTTTDAPKRPFRRTASAPSRSWRNPSKGDFIFKIDAPCPRWAVLQTLKDLLDTLTRTWKLHPHLTLSWNRNLRTLFVWNPNFVNRILVIVFEIGVEGRVRASM